MRGLSLAAASGGHSSSRCAGLPLSRPLVAEHRLQTRRLSSCGSRAQPLRGMWDPPRPGLEPVSPAPAGRLSTTAPPGKPCKILYCLTQRKPCSSFTFKANPPIFTLDPIFSHFKRGLTPPSMPLFHKMLFSFRLSPQGFASGHVVFSLSL